MKWLNTNLAALSGGSWSRAALILLVGHLVPIVPAWLLWAFGLLPVFDRHHWVAATIAVVYAVVAVLGVFLRFGVWGTPATYGQSYGEDYMDTFSLGGGFALGWVRWFLQLFLVAAVLLPTVMTVTNVRWWHRAGTEELDALPARAESIPVPDAWRLTETERSRTGFPEFMSMSPQDGPEANGFVEQTFTTSASYDFDDLKTWLASPDWTDAGTGEAFGAIEREKCVTDSTWCDVRLVPPANAEPEYFIRAELEEPDYVRDEREITVRLDYREHAPPDWDVSQETIDRAQSIPVPTDWSRHDVSAEETQNGEQVSQYYAVPEDFTREDLEAWFTGSAWTDPPSGTAFGALATDPSACRTIGVDDDAYLCSAIVAGTERTADHDGPVESVRASLSSDHTVRVTLERNG